MTVELAIVCDSFGMGGTEKVAVTFALHHDRDRVRPRAIALSEPGVRAGELAAAGIDVSCAEGDPAKLTVLLQGADLVHVHRAGLPEPVVPLACRGAGVGALVETNVFGWVDTSPDERQFDAHLLVSKMCAMRYRQRAGLDFGEFHQRQRTLYNPVDIEGLRAVVPAREQACALLGLDASRPTVVRVGRQDDRKWGDILVAMVPRLLKLVPEAQIVLVGTTAHRRTQLRRAGVLDRVVCLSPSSDPHRLAAFYAAADVFASASSIGESFGLAIAEAMALGAPVVTSSTPWADNAQVEVVDNGVNGWVANHPKAFAEAVADLLTDDARRKAFASAAVAKVERTWHPRLLTERLEHLFEAVLHNGCLPPDWSPSAEEQQSFESSYPDRAAAQFRALSARERREVKWGVQRERAGWAWRDLRAHPLQGGRMLAKLALGRLAALLQTSARRAG
ncbi:MAG TPA: glycosyltransferase family 4 protein [Solirubrobacteraceae bacterium]|nr:glycosyltransferase family 4 protein [Solirubrobacteraceae bacterium]